MSAGISVLSTLDREGIVEALRAVARSTDPNRHLVALSVSRKFNRRVFGTEFSASDNYNADHLPLEALEAADAAGYRAKARKKSSGVGARQCARAVKLAIAAERAAQAQDLRDAIGGAA